MERKCLICGKPFPPDTFASRKYCYECHEKRVIESRRRAAERRKERETEAKAKPQPAYIQRRTPNKNDELYCSECRYHGKIGVNLCDYFVKTGERRGCPAGCGCTKRDMEHGPMEKRICEICGTEYEAGKRSRYCQDCRREVLRENALRIIQERRKSTDGG